MEWTALSTLPTARTPSWPASIPLLESGSSCKQKSIKHKIVELLLLLRDLSVYLLLGLGEQQLRMKHTVLLLLDRTLGLQMPPLLVLVSHDFVLPAQDKNIR
jgi:hypothetical protein